MTLAEFKLLTLEARLDYLFEHCSSPPKRKKHIYSKTDPFCEVCGEHNYMHSAGCTFGLMFTKKAPPGSVIELTSSSNKEAHAMKNKLLPPIIFAAFIAISWLTLPAKQHTPPAPAIDYTQSQLQHGRDISQIPFDELTDDELDDVTADAREYLANQEWNLHQDQQTVINDQIDIEDRKQTIETLLEIKKDRETSVKQRMEPDSSAENSKTSDAGLAK